jgi:hypothetical protein
VHIAAIRTRPAYSDWPDSDTFTEAIADLAALDMYEPAWQRKFLGAAAPLEASLRAKYSGIVMDVAWSLFEIRAHRNPELSPNRIWADITSRYLRIRPHPEWSWWAMRGQLVNSPGYMLNYAFGAILIADIRARLVAVRGPFTPETRVGTPGSLPDCTGSATSVPPALWSRNSSAGRSRLRPSSRIWPAFAGSDVYPRWPSIVSKAAKREVKKGDRSGGGDAALC